MNDILSQTDIDNLKLATDKMKAVDFDAARKMELLLEAYEKQDDEDRETNKLREAIEDLPGYNIAASHIDHVKDTADMLGRALDHVQEWRDSKDDEPLDKAVKRLVEKADGPNAEAEKLAKALDRIVAVIDRGDSDALAEVRNLAVEVL